MIELRNVKKFFGTVHAVDGVNFSIEHGEIFGLLGKNGAGKTTTIKMLTLQLKPTSGEIFFEEFARTRAATFEFRPRLDG